MALTKCNQHMANLPYLAGSTGIDNALIKDEFRGNCHHCHRFQKKIWGIGSKELFKISGNTGKGGSPVHGVLGLMLIKPVFLPAIRVSGRV